MTQPVPMTSDTG